MKDLPYLTINFDPRITQFDLSSLKLSRVPNFTQNSLTKFIEELNQVEERKYLFKHRIFVTLFCSFTLLSLLGIKSFLLFQVFFSASVLFLLLSAFVFYRIFVFQSKVTKIYSKYRSLLKKSYFVKQLFVVKRHLFYFWK